MRFAEHAMPLMPLAVAGLLIGARSRSGERTDWVKRVYRPASVWAARRAVVGRGRSRHAPERGRFTRADVDRLVADAWRRYDAQAPSLPARPTVGSRMNIRLACLTVALFRALLDEGVERADALELVSDVTWKIYESWGRAARLLGRLGLHPITEAAFAGRVRPDGTVALPFPFDPPGYVARHVPGADGFGYDIVRCAVADYFRAQGAADLCLAAWCNLDYPLADMLGLTLRRTTTLVGGADRCDFRWRRDGHGLEDESGAGFVEPLPAGTRPDPETSGQA